MPSADMINELTDLLERYIDARRIGDAIPHGTLTLKATFTDRTLQLIVIDTETKHKPRQRTKDITKG